MNSHKITELTGKTRFFECTAQKSHSKFSITNQNDEDLWSDPKNAGTRLQQATGPKTWKANDNDGSM
jgi:hypothetical protein